MTALSRGYRAPHMTDLGTLGLTGSGFEVAAPDIAGRTAFVGTTADAAAASTGRAGRTGDGGNQPELRRRPALLAARARKASVGMFVNNIHGNIQKQALILEQGAVGTTVGGEAITQQTPERRRVRRGRADGAGARARQLRRSAHLGLRVVGEANITPSFTLGGTYTYLDARDLDTDLPPNIEGGTPAPGGTLLGALHAVGQPVVGAAVPRIFAAEQPNLSTLDLGDRRTGATRSRTNIQNFFRNGARNRGWINPGVDGVFGNADDILIETGETLAQVQDRVLGVGVNSAPMYTAVASLHRVRHSVRHAVWTAHDSDRRGEPERRDVYRGISWGMDGPGRGITARYMLKF